MNIALKTFDERKNQYPTAWFNCYIAVELYLRQTHDKMMRIKWIYIKHVYYIYKGYTELFEIIMFLSFDKTMENKIYWFSVTDEAIRCKREKLELIYRLSIIW